jgi:hypothetical protein
VTEGSPRSEGVSGALAFKAKVRRTRSRQSAPNEGKQSVIPPKIFLPIFLAMIVGVYTNLPLNIGVQIAGFFALAPGLVFLFLLRQRAKEIGFYIAMALVCAAIPTMLGVVRQTSIPDITQAFGGFSLSVLAAAGLYLAIQDQDRAYVCRILLIFAIVIGICLLLEVFTPFKMISDYVRKFLYSGRFIYDSDVRDIKLYGHIRPKAFAQEPSGPARFMAYTLSCVIALATDKMSRIIAGFLFLLSLVIISSPSLYAAFIILGMLFVVFRLTRVHFDTPALNALIFGGAVAVVLAVMNFQSMIGILGPERAAAIRSGQDQSTTMRMLIPPQIFYASTERYGVLGAGLGSKQQLQDIAGPIFSQYAGAQFMRDEDGNWGWANAFVDLFIELGPIFGIMFLLLLTRAFPTPFPGATIVAFQAVFLLDTGLPGPRNWAYFAMVASCLSIAIKDHASVIANRRRRRRRTKPVMSEREPRAFQSTRGTE